MTHQPPFAPPPGWEYPQSPSSAPARFTIHYGFALLAIFSLLGTVIPTIFWFAAPEALPRRHRVRRGAAGIRLRLRHHVAAVGRYVDADLGRIRHQPHAEGTTQMKHADHRPHRPCNRSNRGTGSPCRSSWTMPNLVGTDLQGAQDAIQSLTQAGVAQHLNGSHRSGPRADRGSQLDRLQLDAFSGSGVHGHDRHRLWCRP